MTAMTGPGVYRIVANVYSANNGANSNGERTCESSDGDFCRFQGLETISFYGSMALPPGWIKGSGSPVFSGKLALLVQKYCFTITKRQIKTSEDLRARPLGPQCCAHKKGASGKRKEIHGRNGTFLVVDRQSNSSSHGSLNNQRAKLCKCPPAPPARRSLAADNISDERPSSVPASL